VAEVGKPIVLICVMHQSQVKVGDLHGMVVAKFVFVLTRLAIIQVLLQHLFYPGVGINFLGLYLNGGKVEDHNFLTVSAINNKLQLFLAQVVVVMVGIMVMVYNRMVELLQGVEEQVKTQEFLVMEDTLEVDQVVLTCLVLMVLMAQFL
jgi:hypothetical protein